MRQTNVSWTPVKAALSPDAGPRGSVTGGWDNKESCRAGPGSVQSSRILKNGLTIHALNCEFMQSAKFKIKM